MAIIAVDHIKPGMVLASEVKDIYGRLLCSAGTVIMEKQIRIFRTWGIAEADISGIEDKDVIAMSEEKISPDRLRKAEEELKDIFRHNDLTDPAIKELFHLCVLRKAAYEP